MRPVHERLLGTAERLSFQSGALMEVKSWKAAETFALNAVGILLFLMEDQETSEAIRARADNLIYYQRTVAAKARSEWLKKRDVPKMSGKRSTGMDPELDETLDMVQLIMRDAQEEFKRES